MKIAGSEFEVEEMLFLPALVLFFGMIFIGAWNFSADSALFPIMISAPALVFLAVYVLRGLLPPRMQVAITRNDRFAIGKKPEKLAGEGADGAGNPWDAYVIFAFTAMFALLAYLLGFYISAVLSVAAYTALVRHDLARAVPVGLVVAAVALSLIYIFDSAFGHRYAQGLWVSL